MGANRLLKLTKTCKKINIDKESKIVLMSDVHRGDGGSSDSLIGNKNIYLSALRYYYKEDYTLIEIGDGDELWKNKNFIDIGYIYKEVFRMLNRFNTKNKLYMLYGNHDKKKNSKKFIEKQKKFFRKIDKDFGKDCLNLINNIEFLEALSLKYIHNGKEIFLAHGHQLDFMNDELELVSRFLVRYLWRFLEGVAGFKEPISSAKNYKKGSKVDKKLNSPWKTRRRRPASSRTPSWRASGTAGDTAISPCSTGPTPSPTPSSRPWSKAACPTGSSAVTASMTPRRCGTPPLTCG